MWGRRVICDTDLGGVWMDFSDENKWNLQVSKLVSSSAVNRMLSLSSSIKGRFLIG